VTLHASPESCTIWAGKTRLCQRYHKTLMLMALFGKGSRLSNKPMKSMKFGQELIIILSKNYRVNEHL
jgi:hypothetical protein